MREAFSIKALLEVILGKKWNSLLRAQYDVMLLINKSCKNVGILFICDMIAKTYRKHKNYVVFEDFANVKYSYLVLKAKYNCYFASYNIFDLDVTTNHSFSNFTVALPATVHYWKKGKNQIGLASHYQFFQ